MKNVPILVNFLEENREKIWLSHMTEALTPTEKSKKQCDNTKTQPKSITQRLRTDLGRSIVVTTGRQFDWMSKDTQVVVAVL